MSRFRGHIERRIYQAVVLVLGSCGSMDAKSPQQPTETTQPIEVVTASPDAAFSAPPPDAANVTTPPSDTEAVGTVVGPNGAKVLCEKYKKTSRVDPAKAKQAPPPPEGSNAFDHASWDAKNGVAMCTIVHQRKSEIVTVMHTPHWCPQSGGTRPGPSPTQVHGEKLLVERATIKPDGTVTKKELEWTASGISNEPRHNCGRRFEGLELAAPAGSVGAELAAMADQGSVGAELAAMAELEAASVPAFDRLARELAAWEAPAELVERAWKAKRDEVRHARVMTRLAREHGHAPRAIVVPPLPVRTLEAIAHENAIEGCVREAYGALVATFQAERARPELRAVFRAIAIDEREHAALAEAVHAWILERLAADQREAIERARASAEVELRTSLGASRACSELGLPDGAEALALCDAYFS